MNTWIDISKIETSAKRDRFVQKYKSISQSGSLDKNGSCSLLWSHNSYLVVMAMVFVNTISYLTSFCSSEVPRYVLCPITSFSSAFAHVRLESSQFS